MMVHYLKTYTNMASVSWFGSHQHGKGAITTASAALIKARYASGINLKRHSTNPTELIAAAHASSFSITLADELGEAGYKPRQIDTTASVSMEDIGAGWTMTRIHLDVIATVPTVVQCDFVDAALRAKANCPISRSLNANISMHARLSPRTVAGGHRHQRNPAPSKLVSLKRTKQGETAPKHPVWGAIPSN
jgi:osmotically inducible protein OsmC